MIRLIRSASNWRICVLAAGACLFLVGICKPQQAAPEKPADAAATQKPADGAAAQQPVPISQTIKKESRLVLVDTVVTDKKGNYIHDLTQGDFKVYEDNKEQAISSFSTGANAAGPQNSQKRYLVLFFDNSSMALPDQISARAAAAKFIDANAAPDRLMAVVEFGGALQVKQNFTANAELLQAAAKGVKSSYVASNTDPGGPGASSVNLPGMSAFSSIETDYGARSMLLAVRTLAKNLRSVPGRKALVLFSSGFQLTPERQSELTATIDACNKSNVAVYALDVRGVQAPTVGGRPSALRLPNGTRAKPVSLQPFAKRSDSALRGRLVLASFGEPQRPGGGGAGGGAGGGGRRCWRRSRWWSRWWPRGWRRRCGWRNRSRWRPRNRGRSRRSRRRARRNRRNRRNDRGHRWSRQRWRYGQPQWLSGELLQQPEQSAEPTAVHRAAISSFHRDQPASAGRARGRHRRLHHFQHQ